MVLAKGFLPDTVDWEVLTGYRSEEHFERVDELFAVQRAQDPYIWLLQDVNHHLVRLRVQTNCYCLNVGNADPPPEVSILIV